jgi:hypothetical protein
MCTLLRWLVCVISLLALQWVFVVMCAVKLIALGGAYTHIYIRIRIHNRCFNSGAMYPHSVQHTSVTSSYYQSVWSHSTLLPLRQSSFTSSVLS